MEDGHFYDEHSAADEKAKYPMTRGTFDKDEIRLDLSGLGLDRTDKELFKDHYKMLTLGQLQLSEDSLRKQMAHRSDEQERHLANSLYIIRKDRSPGEPQLMEIAIPQDPAIEPYIATQPL